MKKSFLLVIPVSFVFLMFSLVYAGPSRAAKMEHADKNDDGVVDRKEIKQELRFEHQQKAGNNQRMVSWENSPAKVNTPLEAKYDLDNNGWLQPEEAKELIKDKYILIKTNGQAKVNTPLEAEYDLNNDGIIDLAEAELMAEDTK